MPIIFLHTKTYRNAYTYENDRIKTISHNTTDDNTNDVTYTFGYDDLGRKTTVKVGSQVLSANEYDAGRNTLLTGVEYGNGDKVSYSYDTFDRLTGMLNPLCFCSLIKPFHSVTRAMQRKREGISRICAQLPEL